MVAGRSTPCSNLSSASAAAVARCCWCHDLRAWGRRPWCSCFEVRSGDPQQRGQFSQGEHPSGGGQPGPGAGPSGAGARVVPRSPASAGRHQPAGSPPPLRRRVAQLVQGRLLARTQVPAGLHDVVGRGGTFDRDYRIVRHDNPTERWVYGLGKLGRCGRKQDQDHHAPLRCRMVSRSSSHGRWSENEPATKRLHPAPHPLSFLACVAWCVPLCTQGGLRILTA